MAGRIVFVLALLLMGLWQLETFRNRTLEGLNRVRKELVVAGYNLHRWIGSYINTAHKVRQLEIENRQLTGQLYQLLAQLEHCRQLKEFKTILKPYLKFTQVIGYANLPSFTKVFIDYNGTVARPKGVIYNGVSAGIVVKNFGKSSLVLLNSDSQTSYTVLIGKNRVPGIFYGGQFIIKYIPLFKKIEVGDEVVTSGIDKIFYPGVKVGKVVAVEETKLYQKAVVKPYYTSLTPDYFYVVEYRKGAPYPPLVGVEKEESLGEEKNGTTPSDLNSTDQNSTDRNSSVLNSTNLFSTDQNSTAEGSTRSTSTR